MGATRGVSRNGRAVTRQDVLDAVGDLKSALLDPDNPLSLYASIESKFDNVEKRLREHVEEVQKLAKKANDTHDDLQYHKEQYASDKGRVIGWAGAISAVASAAVKYILPSK